jgi:hypothetical protein
MAVPQLLIHSSVSGQSGCIEIVVTAKITAVCTYLFENPSLLLGICSEVALPPVQIFQFLHILASIFFLNNSHPKGCEVGSHGNVDIYFPNNEWQ